MNTPFLRVRRRVPLRLIRLVAIGGATLVGTAAWGDHLIVPDRPPVSGRLVGGGASGIAFRADGSSQAIPLQPGASLTFDGPGLAPTSSVPPFRLDLGLGQRLSGRLGAVRENQVRLDDGPAGASITVARPGVLAVTQRPGEAAILHDDFETLLASRWSEVGEPEIVQQPHLLGEHSVRLPAGGASLTCRLTEAVGSGRLEVSFFDSARVVSGQQWFVDLLFRGKTGPEPVRAVLGWSEETLGVESPRGPSLAVQRLTRSEGWHRLSVRFGPERTELAVDGNALAHGKGPEGPLVEIRLATYATGKSAGAPGLAGHIDDLRLVRFAEPSGRMEVDPGQDDVRLIEGDQVFGALRAADADRVVLRVLGGEVSLPWSQISGVYLRRMAVAGQPVEGLLVRLEWRSAPGNDPADLDQIEGALTGVSDSALSIATPYAGSLTIPRDRLRQLHVLGRGRRIILDPTAHHLGNEVSNVPPLLDPPQPEGGVLERSFTLDAVPQGAAALVLDVIQVVGESSGAAFSDEVRAGGLRTYALVNGKSIDYLNKHVTSRNETPERIRLAIPAGLLKTGMNRIRIEQKGRLSDPQELDDLGVLGIALEFGPAGTSPAEKP